jgi:hypothetical protein
MFGLFNRKQKISDQISTAVMGTIRLCFSTSKYLDARGVFQAPYEFWKDSYIVGFVYGLSGYFLNFDFSGSSMKVEDKGEIMIRTMMGICKNDYKQALSLVKQSAAFKDAAFELGLEHSLLAYGAASGRLRDDEPSTIITLARELAKTQHEMNIGMSETLGLSPASTNSSLGMAVIQLTIMEHIKRKYIS